MTWMNRRTFGLGLVLIAAFVPGCDGDEAGDGDEDSDQMDPADAANAVEAGLWPATSLTVHYIDAEAGGEESPKGPGPKSPKGSAF